jgi:lysophospholipase L1-like esterase
MTTTRTKFFLAFSSSAIAALAAGLYVAHRVNGRGSGEVRLIDNSREVDELLVQREKRFASGEALRTSDGASATAASIANGGSTASDGSVANGTEARGASSASRATSASDSSRASSASASTGSSGASGPSVASTRSGRYRLTAEEAALFFPVGEASAEFDPFMMYRHRCDVRAVHPFADHPDGHFLLRTSHEGYREDFDHLPEKRDLFVVVTGDSHTDGMCNNRESFANVLEASIAAKHPGRAIEVLNTGMVGYSFFNYVGALEKLVPEKPDAFVVAFYGGNDFLDMVKLSHYFHHTAPPPRRAEYWEQMGKATAVSSTAVANALNQLLYFRYYPDQMAVAERAVLDVSAEIRDLCAEHGIALVYVYVPVGFDVDGKLKPSLAEAKEVLELSRFDLQEYNHMADRSIAKMREMGIDVIDLRDKFKDPIDTYYWSDLHINLKAHALIAELLLPKIEAACASRLK